MVDETYLRERIAEHGRRKQSAMRLARTSQSADTRSRMRNVAKAHAGQQKALRAELRQLKSAPVIAKGMRQANGVVSRTLKGKAKRVRARKASSSRSGSKSTGS